MKVAIRRDTPARDRVIALARRWRPRNIERAPVRPTHTATLIDQVAFWHGVTVDEILGRSRALRIIEARFDAIAAVYTNCRIAGRRPRQTELGRVFDRDHATIIQALKRRGLYD